jgi:hypothetical protein
MKTRRDLLAAVYASFNARNIEGALDLMTLDVDWPNGMDGGRVHGRDDVRSYWKRQWGIIDPHVEPASMQDDEHGNTVVTVHQVIRDLTGIVLKDHLVHHVYSFKNDLISRMDIKKS